MAGVEVSGPFRGYYLCKLPPDTTVGVSSDEDFLFNHPLGQQSKELKATGKDRYVFFKAKGKTEKQTGLKLGIPRPRSKRAQCQAQPYSQWEGADSGSCDKER